MEPDVIRKRLSRHDGGRNHADDGSGIAHTDERRDREAYQSNKRPKNRNGADSPAGDCARPSPREIAGCRSVENYEKLNRINEGAYGIVYRARDKRTSEIVALKKLKLDQEKHGFPVTALREINTLMRAAHPNIVHVREIVVGSSLTSVFIVMDFIEHDLKGLMGTMSTPFVASEIKTLMRQLLSAVAHLHAHWIVHRDLKTSNLLLNNRGELKIADFGLARRFSDSTGRDGGDITGPHVQRPLTHLVVTLWYRAPELLLGCNQYATAVDMWSVGCIFAELILRDPLFAGRGELDQIDRIFRTMGRPQSVWPAGLQLPQAKSINWARYPDDSQLRSKLPMTALTAAGHDLMAQLLRLDPAKRISAEDALKHAYFKENPPPKDPAMFPTFPSVASGEIKKRESPSAPMVEHGYIDDVGVFAPFRDIAETSPQSSRYSEIA